MRFEPALVAVATLAVLVTCTPLQTMPNVTRIPLSLPAPFIKDNGSFDFDGAKRHMAHIENKYRQNRINFRRNVGGDAFNDSADTEPLPIGLQKRQTQPLLRYNDRFWAGITYIGTPPQTVLIEFDTGSADLWVRSASCDCVGKNKYHFEYSNTKKLQEKGVSIKYVDGSQISGDLVSDRVQVGGITVEDQVFVNADKLDLYDDAFYDGILGLGYPELAVSKQSPFFHTAMDQKVVSEGVFAFALGGDSPELHLGGIDKEKLSGPIEYQDVIPSDGHWRIGGAFAFVGEAVMDFSFEAIIDTGAYAIAGPPDQVKEVYGHIEDASLLDPSNNELFIYQYPCKISPGFSIGWGKTRWSVLSENFSNGEAETAGMCVGSLVGVNHYGPNTWVLGRTFLMNMYTVFNFDSNSVGFASIKKTALVPDLTGLTAVCRDLDVRKQSTDTSTAYAQIGKE